MKNSLKKISLLISTVLISTLVSCGNGQTASTAPTWDKEVNLLVVGAGGAGLSAAIEAADNGTENILLVEQMPTIGGVSFLSEGMIAGYDTNIAKKLGVEVSKEDMYDCVMGNAKYRLDPELTSITVEKSGETVDWLDETIGVPFKDEIMVGYGPLQMMHLMDGGGKVMREPFEKALEDRKIEVMLETPATKLLKDADGNIEGAIIKNDGKEMKVKAKAVVLATGGYAANGDLAGDLHPSYKDTIGVGYAGNDGSGLVMASEIGASIVHTDHLMAIMKDYEIVAEMNGNSTTGSLNGLPKADSQIFVGAEGKRFMDEKNAGFMSQDLNQHIFDQMSKDETPYVWILTDKKGLDQSKAKRGLDQEYITADTVEDLASKISVDPTNLKATFENWNTMASNGVDTEFGRTKGLVQLEAPYYALAVTPCHLITYGGISRTVNAEALQASGNIINGLYVAGEVSANSAYMGFTLSNAITWGRIAGANAADYIKNGPKTPAAEEESKEEAPTTEPETFSFKAGTYTGSAKGNGGDVKVEVTVDEKSIKEVKILEHKETEGLAEPALEKVPAAIVEKQSTSVDTVTGATITSNAIMDAVKSALESAK